MAEYKVIYQSRRGNTEKVAEAIAETCGTKAICINEPAVLGTADLLFIGMGVYGGRPDNSLLDYIQRLPVNTIKGAALFSTSVTASDHTELVVNALVHKGITIFPKHLCLHGRMLFMAKGHPDEDDLEAARAFARRVMKAFKG